MGDLFIPYELALTAKEKGFNEPCFSYFDIGCQLVFEKSVNHEQYYQQSCLAPLYQQIINWLNNMYSEKQIPLSELVYTGSKMSKLRKDIKLALDNL